MRPSDYLAPQPLARAETAPCGPTRPSDSFSAEQIEEGRTLLRLGVAGGMVATLMWQAQARGTSVHREALASGLVDEAALFEAMAKDLGLPFRREIDPNQVSTPHHLDSQLRRPEMLRVYSADQPPMTVIAPTLAIFPRLKARLASRPALASMLSIASPSLLRDTAWRAGEQHRLQQATDTLFRTDPDLSARVLWRGWQGFLLGLGLAVSLSSLVLAPFGWILAVHGLLTSVYCLQFLLRVSAFAATRERQPAPRIAEGERLPVYSILVALHDEAAMVPQLIAALNALSWPRSRLDIKLVCEADDAATLRAVAAQRLGPDYEVVLVPPSHPRTKPKALQYALPGVRGDYVTVYDAEDRPHPDQLREALAAFRSLPAEVACLQAPLVVSNARSSWLSALFAVDYAGLFRALLPLLAKLEAPLPLGGTSNHFKTDPLRAVGGWDPFNLTEDADLGMRLHRLGYRTGVLSLPTLEDAPVTLPVWLGQRTRWYKGWLQTYIVMMRKPGRLMAELGPRAFLLAQVTIGGMLLSALGHPLILAFVAYLLFVLSTGSSLIGRTMSSTLLVIDLFNLFGSYAITIGLGLGAMQRVEKRAVGWRWLLVPAYWLTISAAAWSAVRDLRRRPTAWQKTPHRPAEKSDVGHGLEEGCQTSPGTESPHG